jgi:bifunctional non-homologous end joining protein LigD
MPDGSLRNYHAKRDFTRTAEPKGKLGRRKSKALRYLIQKHDASRLHYDVRLEWNGTLMSWAVPKGPSENPDDKRLAVHVEDHPVEYGSFEGIIPAGQYGGGTVMLWDEGTWEPQEPDVDAALKKGKLAFILYGERLKGKWALVKLRKRSLKDKDNWLLIKELDEFEKRSGKLMTERETTSIVSGRSMEKIAAGDAVWESKRKAATPIETQGRETQGRKHNQLKKKPRKRAGADAAALRRAATGNAGRRPASRK